MNKNEGILNEKQRAGSSELVLGGMEPLRAPLETVALTGMLLLCVLNLIQLLISRGESRQAVFYSKTQCLMSGFVVTERVGDSLDIRPRAGLNHVNMMAQMLYTVSSPYEK